MKASLFTKMLMLVFMVMLLTSGLLMVVSKLSIERYVSEEKAADARNLLSLAMFKIKQSYSQLQNYSATARARDQVMMREAVEQVQSLLKTVHRASAQGHVSQREAQRWVLHWVGDFRYGQGFEIYVFDKKFKVLSHTDKKLIGTTLKGQRARGMESDLEQVKQELAATGEAEALLRWPETWEQPGQQMVRLQTFEPWGWVVVAAMPAGIYASEMAQGLEALEDGLRETFSQMVIGQAGYMYVLSGDRKMVIHPTIKNFPLEPVINPVTGRDFADDVRSAAFRRDNRAEYIWPIAGLGQGEPQRKVAFAEYFQPLDWYVVYSIPVAELATPARDLVLRQAVMIFVLIVGAAWVVCLIAKRSVRPFETLAQCVKAIPSGNFSEAKEARETMHALAKTHSGEFGALAKAVAFMHDELQSYVVNLSEAMRANRLYTRQLENANGLLNTLSAKIITAQEDERRRMSRELHDSILQTLGVVRLFMEIERRKLRSALKDYDLERLDQLIEAVKEAIGEVRRIIYDLRPSVLDDCGLLAALESLAAETMRALPGVRVTCELDMDEDLFSEQQRTVLFRVAQESLNNVIKHSTARSVVLSLRPQDEQAVLTVSDDGKGFAFGSVSGQGVGLESMRERVTLVGGELEVYSAPGEGTVVTAMLPLSR